MATAYNIRNKLAQSSNADRSSRADPGATGVIIVSPVDTATCDLAVAGARTLEDATGLGLGTTIRVFATVAGVSVNSVAIADGSSKLFVVAKSAADVKEWHVAGSTVSTLPTITGDTSLYVEATITGIISALEAAGIVIDGTTT